MDFLNASFRIGRLFDIDIRVHILFVVFIAWRLISAGSDALIAAVFLALLFGVVLMHEFGHCFGARSVGGDARNILMWPLGGLAYAHAPMRPWPQFVTVASGPLVNVLFCLVSALVIVSQTGSLRPILLNPLRGIGLPYELDWLGCVWVFYQVNLLLLAFNLLPIYPLDGGQLFHAIIWPFLGLQRATVIACYVGIAGCVMLGVWGMQGGGTMLFFIAIFGGFTCYQRLKMAQYGMLIDDSRFTSYNYLGRSSRRPGFLSRLFKRGGRAGRRSEVERPATPVQQNPRPGVWEAKQAERERLDMEVDRILRKVSERGIQSLSYVERQTLERATRQRQREERQFQRDSKL